MWLMMRPTSSQLARLTSSTAPVSGSISTSHTWAPFGQDGVDGVSVAETRITRPGCRAAISPRLIERSVPAILNRLFSYSMSRGAASRASAANALHSILSSPAFEMHNGVGVIGRVASSWTRFWIASIEGLQWQILSSYISFLSFLISSPVSSPLPVVIAMAGRSFC